jgi:type I restriction enzyme S subunit
MAGEWAPINLGSACEKIGSGATPRGGSDVYLARGPFALIRSQNVYNDGFHHDGLAYIGEKHAAELDGVEVLKDDVLLNITGDSVARACQVDPRVLPARVNQHVAIIRPDAEKLDPRFLRYFLVSPEMQVKLLSWAGSGGTRNALTKGMIESFDVPAPEDIDEQRAIAHILGTLDDKIELNRRMNATLEAMARALFKSWFVDFDPVRAKAEGRDPGLPKPLVDLFPDSFEDSELGEIPKGWLVRTLGEHMANFDSKRVPVSGAERAKRQGHYPYHGAAGVMDHVDGYLFDGIHLLVGEDGSVVQDTGIAVTQYVWGKIWVNNHAHVLKGARAVSTEQLYLYFHFEPVAPYVTGAVQPKLSQGRMNAMPFVFAGDAVCRAFGQTVNPWFARLRAGADEARRLSVLRDALLPKLISGELRVEDASHFIGTGN